MYAIITSNNKRPAHHGIHHRGLILQHIAHRAMLTVTILLPTRALPLLNHVLLNPQLGDHLSITLGTRPLCFPRLFLLDVAPDLVLIQSDLLREFSKPRVGLLTVCSLQIPACSMRRARCQVRVKYQHLWLAIRATSGHDTNHQEQHTVVTPWQC